MEKGNMFPGVSQCGVWLISQVFQSQTDGRFYPDASEKWLSFPQRYTVCSRRWWGKEARRQAKIKKINHHLQPKKMSSQITTYCSCFRENLVTNPTKREMSGNLHPLCPLTWNPCFSPVRLQNVNDPNIKQQPFPFTIPGRDATHTEENKERVRKSFG